MSELKIYENSVFDNGFRYKQCNLQMCLPTLFYDTKWRRKPYKVPLTLFSLSWPTLTVPNICQVQNRRLRKSLLEKKMPVFREDDSSFVQTRMYSDKDSTREIFQLSATSDSTPGSVRANGHGLTVRINKCGLLSNENQRNNIWTNTTKWRETNNTMPLTSSKSPPTTVKTQN